MIYAMSDIHGCLDELEAKMKFVDLDGDNQLILLGDYIDYGWKSRQVLEYVYELHKEYGEDKLVILKGNHEAMFLNWIHEYEKPMDESDKYMSLDDWLRTDFEHGGRTIRSFLTKEQLASFEDTAKQATYTEINQEAVQLILDGYQKQIKWLETLPSYYETDKQIFVHAGVDEDAGENWRWGGSDSTFLWTFQAAKGHFYKDVIAGHLGTSDRKLSGNRRFHDIYHDGESHYYIDGSVYKRGGKLNLLAYDEKTEEYYSIQDDGGMKKVTKYI